MVSRCRSRLVQWHSVSECEFSPPDFSRGDHGFGSSYPAKISAVRSGIVAARARLSGEEQAILYRCGEFGSAIRLTWQGERIGAARERIGAPTFELEQLDPAGEVVTEQGDQLADGKIEKTYVVACFELGRQAAAEISLNLGSAERAEMIDAGLTSIRTSEKTALFIKFFGVRQR